MIRVSEATIASTIRSNEIKDNKYVIDIQKYCIRILQSITALNPELENHMFVSCESKNFSSDEDAKNAYYYGACMMYELLQREYEGNEMNLDDVIADFNMCIDNCGNLKSYVDYLENEVRSIKRDTELRKVPTVSKYGNLSSNPEEFGSGVFD